MESRQRKRWYFLLEGINSFATVTYFYYFYFFMHEVFGFGNKPNLVLAALNGAAYAVGSFYAGKLARRVGYHNGLKIGFGLMASALLVGSQLNTALGHILVMVCTVVGMSFTWPILEALVSEGEDPRQVPHMVGMYNVVWAATGAVAYFLGGALLKLFGLRFIFFLPFAINVFQLLITTWIHRRAPRHPPGTRELVLPSIPHADAWRPSPARAKTFLRMAWLANPFAYIGINTVIAVVPGIAGKLGLSTMEAGFVCSVWLFARLGAFTLLWLWDGWHYRFNWLVGAFAALIASFAAILMLPNVPALVISQLVFGGALGLLYYSSLYYSMDVAEAKSEHGGIHEAVIGLGNLAGPAVGAASIHFLPQYTNSGAIAVSLLLLCGLGALISIWHTGKS